MPPSKNNIWEPLAQEIGAKFIHPGFFTGTIVHTHNNWKIILDTPRTGGYESERSYTRIRLAYSIKQKIDFKIYKKSLLNLLKKLFFNINEIEIQDAEFDKNHIIEGSDSSLIKNILNDSIQEQITSLTLPFLIEDKKSLTRVDEAVQNYIEQRWPEDIGVLCYFNDSIIKNTDELKKFLQLFSSLIDQFVLLGIAEDERPRFEFPLHFHR